MDKKIFCKACEKLLADYIDTVDKFEPDEKLRFMIMGFLRAGIFMKVLTLDEAQEIPTRVLQESIDKSEVHMKEKLNNDGL